MLSINVWILFVTRRSVYPFQMKDIKSVSCTVWNRDFCAFWPERPRNSHLQAYFGSIKEQENDECQDCVVTPKHIRELLKTGKVRINETFEFNIEEVAAGKEAET